MTCPHSETTLLWLYGELADAPADHLAQCAACQALVAEHEEVVSALGPALGALSAPIEVLPAAANRPWRGWVSATAVAAVGIAAVGLWTMSPAPPPPRSAEVALEADRIDDRVDRLLDDLEWELDVLTLDLETL